MLNRFLLGSNSRDLIEDAPVPVLLVPKESNYQPFKKIGFATDLTESDLNAIHEVARLFSMFNPELLLTHVSPLPSDFHDPRTPANQFLNEVTGKINYSKIYYRHITEAAIHKGLLWVTEYGRIDLLAMIHRKHSGLSNLLRSSYTKKVADLITLPLLIMPENHEPISW
ncbi:Universal stress protein family protein [compost metagenome]